MTAHDDPNNTYGSDRANLVYGRSEDGRLCHISEVHRGLACGCFCPACDRQLIARTKADRVVPHFAHNSGQACAGGPETVLHLLAKEIFRSNPIFLLPQRSALDSRGQVVVKPAQEVETQLLQVEYNDPERIIPDLYLSALGHGLFVEVAVTHFSGKAKIQHLRQHRIPAVEVDLSRLPRDSMREAIADAVLRSAPRRWLYHPGIDAADAKWRTDEEEWLASLEMRRAAAQNKHERYVNYLLGAYRTTRPYPAAEIPRLAELRAVGLARHVGIEVAGAACFAVPPGVWQARILAEVFHDRRLGNSVCKAISITQYLDKVGVVRKPFRRVPGMVADDVAAVEPKFAPPWKSVDTYLKRLCQAGVLEQQGLGMVLATTFADPWKTRTLAEKKRTAAMQEAVQAVDWILAELPGGERGSMSGESWLNTIHSESGLTYRAAVQSAVEAPKILAEISVIVGMLERHGPLPHGTCGLPIERAINRHRALLAERATVLRKKQTEDLRRLQQSRRDRLCVDAETSLCAADLQRFLNTKRDELSGMTPIEASEDSESGLGKARSLLSDFVRQLARDTMVAAERKLYQDMITADATRLLVPEHVDAFLNGRDDDLRRMSPLRFVQDESTYRKALNKLSEWQQHFGHLS